MSRFRRVAVMAIVAGAVALASPAGALPQGDPDDPPEPIDKADLRVSALAVTPVGTDWSVTYTVTNSGLISAAASTLSFNGGGGAVAQRSVVSLPPGTSRSGSLLLPRSECYVVMNVTADSARVVTESNESNNLRVAYGVQPPCPARYKVSAYSFKALEETGIDQSGSDEPYWIFNSVGTSGTAASRASQVFGDVDEDETRYFAPVDSCIWGCGGAGAPAPFGIGLSVQLWEQDLGHVNDTLYDTADFFETAGPIATAAGAPAWVGTAATTMGKAMNFILGWADDDLIGTNTYAFDAAGLAAALPARGSSFSDTRIYENSDGKYSLTMHVSRII
jgi:hypothetical protein